MRECGFALPDAMKDLSAEYPTALRQGQKRPSSSSQITRGQAALHKPGDCPMAQLSEISVQSASWDDKRGVCAQDFETTVHSYVNPSHLRGLLNFSALWNRVTYICDTAIGDNPHLLNSFNTPPPNNGLYDTFKEFAAADIVRCLFRNRVTIDGIDICNDPTTADLYRGWLRRDNDVRDSFQARLPDDQRNRYNEVIDRLLFHELPSYAVKRYNPDIAKDRFRQLIRDGITQQGPLSHFISRLPSDVRREYERTCAENDYFSTVHRQCITLRSHPQGL
jgi:hypothetical protein